MVQTSILLDNVWLQLLSKVLQLFHLIPQLPPLPNLTTWLLYVLYLCLHPDPFFIQIRGLPRCHHEFGHNLQYTQNMYHQKVTWRWSTWLNMDEEKLPWRDHGLWNARIPWWTYRSIQRRPHFSPLAWTYSKLGSHALEESRDYR